ncbi:MAG TPA: helix-turn-helix domain-containing protein, partial [Thermoanaerobaculia bacterium]|nr:helix-turn-helix domain-containing protein [Thermoanaerobaculia bacterium]
MRVTVREAAALLNAPERKVYAWIESGDLPAYRINDQYRINRSELLEWATARKLTVDPALFHGEDEDERIPSVAESLERGGVFHDVGGATREEALRSIIALLKLDDEGDRKTLLDLLLARDAAAVVPVGDGIAIPH